MHSRNYIGQVPFYQNFMLLWDLSLSLSSLISLSLSLSPLSSSHLSLSLSLLSLSLSLSDWLSELKFVDCNPLHNFLLKLSDISKKNSEVLSYFITIL